MTHEDIRIAVERALHKVAPEADASKVDPHADLRDALDLDSMDFLGFVTQLHAILNVDVPERDYGKVRTLDDAVADLASRLAPASA